MPLINFSNVLQVNVESIDKQHREISAQINRLYELVKDGSVKAQVEEMEEFNKLLNDHFDNEEQLMTEHKDPHYFSHKYEHNRMRAKTEMVLNNLKIKEELLTEQYVKGLRTWFDNHLELKDIKLGKFLNSLGIY